MNFDLPPGPPPSPSSAPNPTPRPAATVTTSPDDRGTAYKPVEGGELMSGEKLLVEAYAAIWIIVFVMVLLSWRRQSKIEERIRGLEGAIAKARADKEP